MWSLPKYYNRFLFVCDIFMDTYGQYAFPLRYKVSEIVVMEETNEMKRISVHFHPPYDRECLECTEVQNEITGEAKLIVDGKEALRLRFEHGKLLDVLEADSRYDNVRSRWKQETVLFARLNEFFALDSYGIAYDFDASTIQQHFVTILNGEPVVDAFPDYNRVATIIDYDSGSRWEGETYEGVEEGYGEFYNDLGILVYRGEMHKGKRHGYGTSFFSDNGFEHYSGTFYNGDRYGYGVERTRFGDVYREGWYVLDEYVSNELTIQKDTDLDFLHTQLIELHIGDNTLNSIPTLNLDQLKYLKILSVGDYCLQKIESFIITALSELEQITIGSFCCIGKLPNRGSFSLSSLPSLRSIRIGVGSFRYYRYLMVKSRS